MWDNVTNKDFKSDCILGFFRNHPTENPNRLGEKFGSLTAVKDISFSEDGMIYEENYGRRWNHFRPATKEEILKRTFYC